jgi:hypothetical protein
MPSFAGVREALVADGGGGARSGSAPMRAVCKWDWLARENVRGRFSIRRRVRDEEDPLLADSALL